MPSYYDHLYGSNYSDDLDSGYGANAYSSASSAPKSSPMASSAMAAPFMATPAGAGVAVGGAFLTQYLAQKAQDERDRRNRESQNIQSYAQNQDKGLDTLNNVWRSALSRRG